jgi:hypothetical protein
VAKNFGQMLAHVDLNTLPQANHKKISQHNGDLTHRRRDLFFFFLFLSLLVGKMLGTGSSKTI